MPSSACFMVRRPTKSTLFPYTTLFRSNRQRSNSTSAITSSLHPHKVGDERGNCRSEEHTSELQSLRHLVCRLLLVSWSGDQRNRPSFPTRRSSDLIGSAPTPHQP